MEFQGNEYTHKQMRELSETDNNPINPLTDWFKSSKLYEYTMYYTYIVFHTPIGFIACYADDKNNFWSI